MLEKTIVFALLTLISSATPADDESLEPCIICVQPLSMSSTA